jgi:hypothetical protein
MELIEFAVGLLHRGQESRRLLKQRQAGPDAIRRQGPGASGCLHEAEGGVAAPPWRSHAVGASPAGGINKAAWTVHCLSVGL